MSANTIKGLTNEKYIFSVMSYQIPFKLSWYSQAQFRVCYNMLNTEIRMEVFRKMVCWLYISGECDTEDVYY